MKAAWTSYHSPTLQVGSVFLLMLPPWSAHTARSLVTCHALLPSIMPNWDVAGISYSRTDIATYLYISVVTLDHPWDLLCPGISSPSHPEQIRWFGMCSSCSACALIGPSFGLVISWCQVVCPTLVVAGIPFCMPSVTLPIPPVAWAVTHMHFDVHSCVASTSSVRMVNRYLVHPR